MTNRPEQNSGPYAGYDSVDDAIAGLRCGRFRVHRTFVVSQRGLVVEGDVIDGDVRLGSFLLPSLTEHPRILAPCRIFGVEFVDYPGGRARVGLVIEPPSPHQALNFANGIELDVVERNPAA